MERYLERSISQDLKNKMVFLGGPRQIGKTTLALRLLKAKDSEHPAYINWDIWPQKEKLTQGEIPREESLVVLDEVHKYKDWRNLVKGLFDIRSLS